MSQAARRLPQPFDPYAIRAAFPALHNATVHGKRFAFLDSAASAQKHESVLHAMDIFQRESYANVHRGIYHHSVQATNAMEAARDKAQHFMGAASRDEIIFTKGATEAINLVAHSFGRQHLTKSDTLILTRMEHHANIVPWQLLQQDIGFTIKVVELDDNGDLKLEQLFALLEEPTSKILACNHISNALGTINPIQKIIAKAHQHDVTVVVDGCQAAPHTLLDMQGLDADFYTFSAHKLYGPTGVGVLYGKAALLNSMPPYQGGGEMIDVVSFSGTSFLGAPHRFEAGTPPITEIIGLGAAIDFMLSQDHTAIAAHEAALLAQATEALRNMPEVTLHGTAKEKASILSFTIKDAHAHDVGTLLDQQGVAVRTGHHCAQPLMQHLGVPATARASFAAYSVEEDVTQFVQALEKTIRMLG